MPLAHRQRTRPPVSKNTFCSVSLHLAQDINRYNKVIQVFAELVTPIVPPHRKYVTHAILETDSANEPRITSISGALLKILR